MTDPIKGAILWNETDAAQATGGTAGGRFSAHDVSIDSRTVDPGDLFVALTGPTFDGHDFVADALSKGAAAAMVHRPGDADPDRLIVVEDTMTALENLGRAGRARAPADVIAVTGSVGKTGTKDMLRAALGACGPTHATRGNLNNHWGVPLTLARMPRHTRFAVVEMGMNHAGEIAALSRQTRPDVAVITAIGRAHIENLGSEEAIAKAKAEIFQGMEPGGVAVIPRDTPHFDRLARAAKDAGARHMITFGAHPEAHVRLTSIDSVQNSLEVHATVQGLKVALRLNLLGRHWGINATAVLAVLQAVDADFAKALPALEAIESPKGRGDRTSIDCLGGSIEVIDESYNANPESMAAALQALAALDQTYSDDDEPHRRIAVLGDMLELGRDGPAMHAELAEMIEFLDIDLVFTAGPLMQHLDTALPVSMRGGHAGNADALIPILLDAVRPGDAIMVKGSAGSHMRRVVNALKELEAEARRRPGKPAEPRG